MRRAGVRRLTPSMAVLGQEIHVVWRSGAGECEGQCSVRFRGSGDSILIGRASCAVPYAWVWLKWQKQWHRVCASGPGSVP